MPFYFLYNNFCSLLNRDHLFRHNLYIYRTNKSKNFYVINANIVPSIFTGVIFANNERIGKVYNIVESALNTTSLAMSGFTVARKELRIFVFFYGSIEPDEHRRMMKFCFWFQLRGASFFLLEMLDVTLPRFIQDATSSSLSLLAMKVQLSGWENGLTAALVLEKFS